MDSITVRNINAEIPSCWNEISLRNLMFLAKRFPYPPTRGFSLSFFLHALDLPSNPRLSIAFVRNLNLSRRMDLDWKNDDLMEFGESNIFEQEILKTIEALKNFDWLHKDPEIEQCLIKKFRIGFSNYYGPDERLCNVTADEFEHADAFMLKFMEDKDEKYLNLFLASLWRESPWFNSSDDIRVPFSEFQLEKRAAKMKRLNPVKKRACILNYLGMRKSFVGSGSAADVFSSTGTASEQTNWGTILLRLAENQVFGIHKEVKKTFIHDIVDHLADLKLRDKQKKRAENVS